MQPFTFGLWFDTQAEEAAQFYTSVFPNAVLGTITHYGNEGFEITGRRAGEVLTVDFQIGGVKFQALNGGPQFKFNPAVSFFVSYATEAEINELWEKLSAEGTVLMALDKYDWSPRYGWLQDKYGISWQITLDENAPTIKTSFLFTGEQSGRAKEAVEFYSSLFSDAEIIRIVPREEDGTVLFSEFSLLGQHFIAMDGGAAHKFNFNEAISVVVDCDTQDEIDYFWRKLTDGGEEGECGWLKDKFGISWQVSPAKFSEWLQDPDQAKQDRLMKVFFEMQKPDIAILEGAFNG